MKIITKSTTGSIEKEILTKGSGSQRATERSKCKCKIEDIEFTVLSTEKKTIAETLESEYLKRLSEELNLIIGDGCSKIDEFIERLIQTMLINEYSLAKITLPNPEKKNNENVSISFKIKLIDCKARKPIWEWTPEEKYEVALIYKEIGVGLHKSLRIVEAFKKFSRACKILITLEPVEDNEEVKEGLRKDIEELRKILYNNMAECHLLRKNFDLVILLCDKVLRRDKNNVKALYRKSVAHENLGDYENAVNFMKKVIALEPRNSIAKEKMIIYKKKIGEAQKNYDNIVKKMFEV